MQTNLYNKKQFHGPLGLIGEERDHKREQVLSGEW